ncbi:MAG TPA: sterol desaturase family protein [Devosia sp.]|nr:sterol desaturase family protein [Devosia sp.]
MPGLGDLLVAHLPTVLALGAIVLFALVELGFPRMQKRPDWREHLPPILSFAALTFATTLVLNSLVQEWLLTVFVPLRVFHLAQLAIPAPLLFVVSFLLVDFFNYVFHRLSHGVPMLWRLHAIHHSDEHVTAVTGQLHHPLEVVASYVFMLFLFVALGVPVVAAIIYGLVYAVFTAFAHADIALPRNLDRWLRWVIVTPDLHRTHHSSDMREGNSNFGQIFTIWDRLLGTYVDRPAVPEAELKMGLPDEARPADFKTSVLLAYPFLRREAGPKQERAGGP